MGRSPGSELEWALFLSAIPRSGFKIPTLSPRDEDKILAVIQHELEGRQLGKKAKILLFRRISYASLTYQNLTGKYSSAYEKLLTWTHENEEEFYRVLLASDSLVTAMQACQIKTRNRFGRNSQDMTYKTLMASATMIAGVMQEAYELRPRLTPPRRPDYAFNGVIVHLAKAWCDATRRPLSRSTNRGKSPIPFISAVLAITGPQAEDHRIESAIRWLIKQRQPPAPRRSRLG
jgi:hypothetical protein